MGRLFSALLLALALIYAGIAAEREPAQPVFFSLLFPQLIPQSLFDAEAAAWGAVFL